MALCLCLAPFSFALASGMPGDFSRGLTDKSLVSTARRIVESVRRPGMSEYDMALALNDWLVDHTSYKAHTTNALNVLNNGYASCSGYANAYCALLKEAGIANRRITGKSFRFDHVWNLVRMGGEWYHVDVRMNDSSRSHLYFGLTHEAIAYNHQGFSHNKNCEAYIYNYGYRSGEYDAALSYIRGAIKENLGNGVPAFMVSTSQANCPSALHNPVSALMIKAIIEDGLYGYMGGQRTVSLSLLDDAIAVHVERLSVLISSVTLDRNKVNVVGENVEQLKPTYQLSAAVYPLNASNQTLFWRSRNEKVATVDSNGLVTVLGYGKAKIMAMAEDGSKKTATCEFTVRRK